MFYDRLLRLDRVEIGLRCLLCMFMYPVSRDRETSGHIEHVRRIYDSDYNLQRRKER
jgi:hypothetical protein